VINTGNGWDIVRLRHGTMENLTVSTGDGNEGSSAKPGVSLNFLSINNQLLLDLGSGSDWAYLGNVTVDILDVRGQEGNDKVVANSMNVEDAIFSMFDGDDFVGLHESEYENLDIFLEDDDDILQARNLTTTRDTLFDGGLGFNTYRNLGGNSLRSLTRINI
jgi:hypothetical protein